MTKPRVIPSPHHPLHGFRLKLNRAQAHAETLDAEIGAWFKQHPYEVLGEYQPGPPEQYVFKVRFLEAIPASWGIILGDFAHNARSALDHLAYQVVLRGNGGIHRAWTQFPIVLAPWQWPGAASYRLNGASERNIGIIESFQPYHRRDRHDWHTVWQALEDPLAILNRLSNVDKHVVLNATPATIHSIGWDLKIVRDVASIGAQEIPMRMLIDEEVMVSAEIVSSGPNPQLKLDRSETVEITVQHRVDLGPESYTLLSVALKESVKTILARLREIFEVFVGEFR